MSILNKKMVIRIEKQSQSASMMQFLVLLPFVFSTLTELLLLPEAIKYICDVIWVCLIILLMLQKQTTSQEYGIMYVWILGFLLYTILVYLVNFQSPFYYLWGFRNNFRFYAAFLVFAYFLQEKQIHRLIQLMDKLFWVNFVVSLVQCYGYGITGDHLGGLFGATQGCNGYSSIFFSITVAKSVVFYLEKKETVKQCLLKCAATMYLAALAELKFFFVAFVVITALAVMFTDFTWRKLGLVLASAIGVAVGTSLLAYLFANGEQWFTVEWMYDLVSSDKGYTSSGDLNRLNAIPQINERWLKTLGQRLFGMGLGNCDAAGFAVVTTPFYESNYEMHYTWMSHAMMYLETGLLGLIFFFGFFVLVFFCAHRIEKRSEGMTKTCCRIARIMAVCCMIIAVYNSSLRTEAGYMVYFILAIPFAMDRNARRRMQA